MKTTRSSRTNSTGGIRLQKSSKLFGYAKPSNDKIADTEIDNLVYELYGLTDNEIKIVEGSD